MTQVLACIDGSRSSVAVCDYAAWASLQLAAPLTFLHVLDQGRNPTAADLSGNIGLGTREHLLTELAELDEKRGKLALEQGRHMLDAAKARAIADGVAQPHSKQRHGDLVDTLLELESDVRLFVLGRQGEIGDSLGAHIGNQVERVVRAVHRPLLITPMAFRKPSRILIAFDGSATTRKGIELIAQSPLFKGLDCHVLMVGSDTADAHEHLRWAQQQLTVAGFAVSASIRAGEVEAVLNAYRQEHGIDLLVMGAYGHSRIRRFFVGSTTTSMLRQADFPLLLLR